jgi:Ca2+/Na+ antiporter
MTNDVAMTKLGFGEMAIAATVAGPLFNVLIGLGTS